MLKFTCDLCGAEFAPEPDAMVEVHIGTFPDCDDGQAMVDRLLEALPAHPELLNEEEDAAMLKAAFASVGGNLIETTKCLCSGCRADPDMGLRPWLILE